MSASTSHVANESLDGVDAYGLIHALRLQESSQGWIADLGLEWRLRKKTQRRGKVHELWVWNRASFGAPGETIEVQARINLA